MKATLPQKLVALFVLLFCLASYTWAADTGKDKDKKAPPATTKAEAPIKEYTGTLQSIDKEEGIVKIDKFLWNKTFNLAQDCAFVTGLEKKVAAEDMKPGMEVVVNYEEVNGILVATHIAQRQYNHTGYVKAVTPAKREIIMDRIGLTRTFKVSDNTQLSLHGKEADLNELKSGQKITLVYTKEGDVWLAQKIEDTSETFSGTIEAIDEGAATLKVKSMIATRKFNLGDGCKIIINGDDRSRLRDLRIGRQVQIHYEEMKGVLAATRIEHIGNENDTPKTSVPQGGG
ncbi:MAG TPA: DUF5666 domain-containing protein [Verrucomicrobiae bacterium]